ncbi:MAG: DUF3500 domain-containing protein, partial [Rhodothermales bacterium]
MLGLILPLNGCDAANDGTGNGGTTAIDCSGGSGIAAAVCEAAAAFDATLSESQQTAVRYDFNEGNADNWSNFPVGGMATRNGLEFADLSDDQLEAALDLTRTALSDAGYGTFDGIRAADDYLGERQGGYGSGLYLIAFLGTPSATDAWMLQLGGHHYALNFTYQGDTASPTPYFVGVEPLTFTLDGERYAPMEERAATATAMLDALSSDQLASAQLSGSFRDVLLGPGADGEFPEPSGLQVSSLDADQRALVTEAIEAWVLDADEDTAAELLAEYTSDAALDETYIGYSGGTDLETQGSYIRIDGPRVWIEIVAQGGIVLSGIHY